MPLHLLALILLLLVAGCDEPARGREGPPDIIVVCMDTLRADRLGIYGNPNGLTPNIDRFAAEAVVFDSAWAVANETLYSHAAMFTSLYATETGPIFETFRLDEEPPTLAGVLGIYGYRSGAFTGGGHLSPAFGLGRGFDTFERSAQWGSLYHSVPRAVSWMEAQSPEQPLFTFIHGYDTHHRYLKPGPWGFSRVDASYQGPGAQAARSQLGTVQVVDGHYFPRHAPADLLDYQALRIRGPFERRRVAHLAQQRHQGARPFLEEDLAFVRGVYDGAVSYGDTWFGLLMARLEASGALEHSVVVLVADHGEELGEDGLFHHRYTLSDLALQVPLIVRLPGGEGGGRRVDGMVDLTDLMPTLLEAAGAEVPAGVRGRSFWPALKGEPWEGRSAVFAQTMFRGISIRNRAGRLGFYGVGADSPFLPELVATSNLDGHAYEASESLDAQQVARMRRELANWAAQLRTPEDAGPTTLSPEQIEVIQQGGYWGAQ